MAEFINKSDLEQWIADNAIAEEDMTLFVTEARSAPDPVPGTWSIAQKGDADGSIVENSSTSLTINAKNTSDEGNQDYAYQSIASGDIQIKALIPATSGWSGNLANWVGYGIGLTEGTADAAYFAQVWYVYQIAAARDKVGVPGAVAEQQSESAALAEYIAITYNDTTKEIKTYHSNDDATYVLISTISKTLTYPVLAYVFGTSQDVNQTTTATITGAAVSGTITITGDPPVAPGERQVYFTQDSSTGAFQDITQAAPVLDGAFVGTLPEPQTGAADPVPNVGETPGAGTEFIATGFGGGGPASDWDTRVFQTTYTPPTNGNGAANAITPFAGSYAIRQVLDRTKNYRWLYDSKTRGAFNTAGYTDYMVPFDVETWFGFAICLPSNHEIETNGTWGSTAITLMEFGTKNSSDMLEMKIKPYNASGNPDGDGGVTHHWQFDYTVDASSSNGYGNIPIDAGDVAGDLGNWVEFVIRFRSNPFTVNTNLTIDGVSQLFEANKGILEIWKDNVQIFSIDGGPVGLRPHSSDKIRLQYGKFYPYDWWCETMEYPTLRPNGANGAPASFSTSIVGPMCICWDEIRWGQTIRDGTGYQDVSPSRSAEPA